MKSDPPLLSHQAPRAKWLQFLPALLSAALAILLYAITLGGGYIYDDRCIVLDDPRVHQPNQWSQLWTRDYFDGGIDNLYRPIVSSSYALQWWLHGDRPWIFHAVNVLLHALSAAAVAELTRRALSTSINNRDPKSHSATINYQLPTTSYRLSTTNLTALIAGLLFAAHPIHVEAVANIVGRAELACTACILVALILFCRMPLTYLRVMSILFVAVTGLFCKEQAILQPLLWIFLGYLIWQRTPERPAIKLLILITSWTWAGYLIFREHFLKFEWNRADIDPTIQPLILSVGIDRILMPVVLLGHYTVLLVWPAHLSLDYGADVIGHIAHITDPYLWFGFFAIAIWIVAAIYCLKVHSPTNRFVLFCLLGLAVTYGMIGNIITLIGTNFAERLMYLPSVFFVMIIAVLIARCSLKSRVTITTALVLLASVRTITAARNWNHPLDLYRSTLAAQPRSIQAYLLLADEYHREGNHPAAAATLQEVCEMYPDYWRVWKSRAEEAINDGNFSEADDYLARAIKLNHNFSLVALGDRLDKKRAVTQPLKHNQENQPQVDTDKHR